MSMFGGRGVIITREWYVTKRVLNMNVEEMSTAVGLRIHRG